MNVASDRNPQPAPEECGATGDDWESARLENRVGQTLRVGVRISSWCLAAGLVLSLVAGGDLAQWLMIAGLMMLMATPVARVGASIIEYASTRDWTFFTLTSIVFLELLAGVGAALLLHRRL